MIKIPKLKFKQRKKQYKPLISADIFLVIYDSNLLLLGEPANKNIRHSEPLLELTPKGIAEAARRLLPSTDAQKYIGLGVANTEFIATTVNLPGVAPESFKSAVHLQLPALLPGLTNPMLLAVQPQSDGGETIALWMSAEKATILFEAFKKVGLFLACILPRPLIALPHNASPCQIYDEDEHIISCLEWSGTAIRRWVQLSTVDCNCPEFSSQFDESLSTLAHADNQIRRTQESDWKGHSVPPPAVYNYAFIPSGVILHIAEKRKKTKHRQLMGLAAVFIAGLLVAAGIAVNYKHTLKKEMRATRARTFRTAHLKAESLKIIEDIEPVQDFPRPNVIAILSRLNELIPKNSWISMLRIEDGNVEIEGYSPSPSDLIKILSAEPQFLNVGFSRTTRSERDKESFGIAFKLKDIDIKVYQEKYFLPNNE